MLDQQRGKAERTQKKHGKTPPTHADSHRDMDMCLVKYDSYFVVEVLQIKGMVDLCNHSQRLFFYFFITDIMW